MQNEERTRGEEGVFYPPSNEGLAPSLPSFNGGFLPLNDGNQTLGGEYGSGGGGGNATFQSICPSLTKGFANLI